MNSTYVNAKDFKDFCNNQRILVEVLNHNMTKLTADIFWIKRIGYYMAAAITAIALKFIIVT